MLTVPLAADERASRLTSAERTSFDLRPPIDAPLAIDGPVCVLIASFGASSAQLTIDGGKPLGIGLRAGALLFLRAEISLRLHPAQPVELLVMILDADRVAAVGERAAPGRAAKTSDVLDWQDVGAASLAQEMRRAILADGLRHHAYLESLADALLTRLLCHTLGELETGERRETLSPGRLARILRHIDEHLDGTLRVAELADLAGLTRSHFTRAFQRMTGEPPQRYILGRRVCRARDLLAAGELGIAEVAARSGFSSQAHLSTAFRQEVGATPARYRAAFRRELAD